jgi:hypothetical protein
LRCFIVWQVDSVVNRCNLSSRAPFLLILNFQIPGLPACSAVVYFALSASQRLILEQEVARLRGEEVDEWPDIPADDLIVYRLLAQFLLDDDEKKSARFKLIPSMVEGPWVVRAGVGSKPVILGKKLTQRYWSGPGYLEIGIDIGSSTIASSVVGMVRDYSRNIVVDLAVLVQVGDTYTDQQGLARVWGLTDDVICYRFRGRQKPSCRSACWGASSFPMWTGAWLRRCRAAS